MERAHIDRRLAPTVVGAGTQEPKGWESQEELKGFFSQFMNLMQGDLQTDTFTTEMWFHLTGTCPFHYLLSLLLSHAALCNRLE